MKLPCYRTPVNPRLSSHISRLNRGARSIPAADLLMVILIMATIVTFPAVAGSNIGLKLMLFVMVVVLILKTFVEYRHKKYDFELVFIFDEAFEKLIPKRVEAVEVCKKYLDLKSQKGDVEKWGEMEAKEREKVEPVLDFFEDIGFYLHGNQISDEVAHHHYYHWVLGYWSVLESYVEFYHKHDPNGEPSAYVWIQPLFERLCEIEKTRPVPKTFLKSYEDKMDFLNEEPG